MFAWPYDLPHRGVGVAGKQAEDFGEFLAPNGSWDIHGEPYTSAPGSDFRWFRSRIVGGRTNHWGRIALRFAPIDFRSYSRDGLGSDWPISYDDVAPYYDKVEGYIGVFGTKENVSSAPDGVFLPPPKPRCTELIVKQACDKLNITCIPSRLAILTKSVNGRLPCHYCGQCGRGCITASNFSSSQVLIPPAMATGKLTLITGAMAREVLVGKDGKATGVSYIDKATRTEQRINARAVVVAASACESTRLLLNSKSALFPDGLANSSGTLGRYLTDSVGSGGDGYLPQLEGMAPHNHDGTGGMHMYMPWWLDNRKLDFPRGYHIEPWGGRDMPGYGFMSGIHKLTGGGYGKKLKDDYRRLYGSIVGFSGRGEMLPNKDCYCEIDPNVVDKYGIPVLRFHWKWTDGELNQARHMNETAARVIEAMGGKVVGKLPGKDKDYGLKLGGEIIHEAGTTRMGTSPRTSVLNEWCQAHDCKNLFVADSGPFVSNAHKNMTWTILALSMRTSEHIVEERRKGNL
jgi:choline dehydrogenase-like flavoprotein